MSNFENQVTNKELDRFYGRDITEIDRYKAIGQASAEVDQDIYSDIAFEQSEVIDDNIGDPYMVGRIIIEARKQWIADQASRALYGRAGLIKSSEVNT